MDALAGLLEGPRARGAFLMRSVLQPPWSLRIEDEAPLTVLAMIRGGAWIITDDDPAGRRTSAGDVVVFSGGRPYVVADDPSTEPQIIIKPGQVTMTPDGEILCETLSLGVREWGTDPHGETMMVTGTYESAGAVSQGLLRALPPVVVLPDGECDTRLLELLVDEMSKDQPAQGAVLDRLLDLLLIAALRAWFARNDAPAWYHAYDDPLVGKALRLLQHNPAHGWTVASLASAVGVSRAALARRFTDLVGEPPMAFLTEWRLALAADLLQDSDATIESIARQVGYGSAFALSSAFKRQFGVSPRDHRRGAAPAPVSSAG
ncbi:AraC family transcriptional regulator [Nocardia cyriacigeorgica]|uniref:AraC family transcriptional regulator n=2 Tax=Nocardia cyriacigeorgica TaxID=135487 RepID=A0A6P1CHL2_9NOCA|nr:AraC family transcriptional regulator [Nocardia cyriacigeorgica]MBF6286982.1 AraC family transcriptional regulator [Nocardia cyriacigeorgica]MBF6425484.1 AraC family transcriptional regulator [Nocardia cyriacigeorgica]NEW31878.1 AraC family transcriptional regulator [Nocardia cyriacigeorgica]CCF61893.1 Putative HTH-type transcriptional regulator (modular protein) [Nocardia cyriacigeorgica GUH-2]